MASWTCDGLTISYASPKGTSRCRRCKLALASGSLRLGMIFKSPEMRNMLFQGFHLHCIPAPTEVTSAMQLEGIEDILPHDVEVIKHWVEMGMASRKGEGFAPATPPSQGLSERVATMGSS